MDKQEPLIDHNEADHDKHLCALAATRQMKTLARLARDGKYLCRACGRVAAKAENLCDPVKLE